MYGHEFFHSSLFDNNGIFCNHVRPISGTDCFPCNVFDIHGSLFSLRYFWGLPSGGPFIFQAIAVQDS